MFNPPFVQGNWSKNEGTVRTVPLTHGSGEQVELNSPTDGEG
jgi:hypothetical protein